jgi:hypothetical protein
MRRAIFFAPFHAVHEADATINSASAARTASVGLPARHLPKRAYLDATFI